MQIQSSRFGAIEIDDNSILFFKEGILGFEQLKRYAIILCNQTEPIQWLQAADDKNVSLPVINPFIICPDYAIDIDGAELNTIEAQDAGDVFVLNVMVIPSQMVNSTINLSAPILINAKNKQGKQFLIECSMENAIRYPAFEPLNQYYKEMQSSAGTITQSK